MPETCSDPSPNRRAPFILGVIGSMKLLSEEEAGENPDRLEQVAAALKERVGHILD